ARLDRTTASQLGTAATVSFQTEHGVLLGTVSYMSPEQVRGQHADARSDVFALGCVLFEMVTGQRPFPGETTADVMVAILHSAPAVLSESGRSRPAALDRVISRCLEKDPARRFPSGADLAVALKLIGQDAALHDSVRQHQPETLVVPASARPSTS